MLFTNSNMCLIILSFYLFFEIQFQLISVCFQQSISKIFIMKQLWCDTSLKTTSLRATLHFFWWLTPTMRYCNYRIHPKLWENMKNLSKSGQNCPLMVPKLILIETNFNRNIFPNYMWHIPVTENTLRSFSTHLVLALSTSLFMFHLISFSP